jgi:hypothetical protein
LPRLVLNLILPISASQVARITGVGHLYSASFIFYNIAKGVTTSYEKSSSQRQPDRK